MSLPTVVKTWQYNVNQQIASAGSVAQEQRTALRAIKDALKGFGTLPWTVQGSSDAVAAGMDATDRWTANNKLVWGDKDSGTPNFSWIVLRQTGIATNFELLLCLLTAGAAEDLIQSYISPSAGFTGGSVSARPTATDEIQIQTGANSDYNAYLGRYASTTARAIHVMQSTDGKCTRVVVCRNGYAQAIWLLDQMANTPSGLTDTFVVALMGATSFSTSIATYARLFSATNAKVNTPAGLASVNLTTTGLQGQPLGSWWTWPGDVNGKYPITRIGVVNTSAPASRGRLGTIVDLYAGSAGITEGATYPADGSFAMAQFGALIFPWNGTLPKVR